MTSDARFKRGSATPRTRVNSRRRDLLAYSLLASFIVGMMLFLVSKENDFFNMGYEITQLRKETNSLREEQLELRAELTQIRRPDRLMQAVMDLGMKPVPSSNRVFVYSKPGSKTVIVAEGSDPILAKLEGGE